MGECYLVAMCEPYVNALTTLRGRYVSALAALRERYMSTMRGRFNSATLTRGLSAIAGIQSPG